MEFLFFLKSVDDSLRPKTNWTGLNYFNEEAVTLSFLAICPSICENCGNLLSSTRLSHVMSEIHFFGFGSTALRSRAAPPGEVRENYM